MKSYIFFPVFLFIMSCESFSLEIPDMSEKTKAMIEIAIYDLKSKELDKDDKFILKNFENLLKPYNDISDYGAISWLDKIVKQKSLSKKSTDKNIASIATSILFYKYKQLNMVFTHLELSKEMFFGFKDIAKRTDTFNKNEWVTDYLILYINQKHNYTNYYKPDFILGETKSISFSLQELQLLAGRPHSERKERFILNYCYYISNSMNGRMHFFYYAEDGSKYYPGSFKYLYKEIIMKCGYEEKFKKMLELKIKQLKTYDDIIKDIDSGKEQGN